MNIDIARQIIYQYINDKYHVLGDELVILDDCTIEKPYGWIFFYESSKYLETSHFSYRILGNGPILVDKTGNVHEFGTAYSVETYLSHYESEITST